MKKFILVSILILIFIVPFSVSADQGYISPSWSTAPIEWIEASSGTFADDAFHFNGNIVRLFDLNCKEFGSLQFAVSSFSVDPNIDSSTPCFYIGYDILMEVTGDPGFIHAFVSDNFGAESYKAELIFKDKNLSNSIYNTFATIFEMSSDGQTFFPVDENIFDRFENETTLYIKLYFRIAASFTVGGFDPWLQFYGYGSELNPVVDEFTVTMLSSNLFYRYNAPDSGLLDMIGKPVNPLDHSGGGGNFYYTEISNFEYESAIFFDNLNSLLNVVSADITNIFNLFLVPFADLTFTSNNISIPILNIIIVFAFIYFVIGIIWLILAMSNKGGNK